MTCKLFTKAASFTIELEVGEELQRHVLQAAITRAIIDPNTWSVFLIVTPTVANMEQDMLRELGFVITGNLQRGTVTFLKLKRHIRTSGEAGSGATSELAVPMPMLASSDFERQAQNEMAKRMATPLSPERLAELESWGKQ
jgi:hypothetical protein